MFGMEVYIFSLDLNLPNLGLNHPVLVLYIMEGHKGYFSLSSSESNTYIILLPRIMPSLFYNMPNTLSLIENAKNFQTPNPLKISGIWPKTSPIALLLLFPSFISC